MKISIIYAACNQGELLRETVDSAIGGLAGCKDWEIVIVDDKSADGCCDFLLLDRDLAKYPEDRVRLIQPAERMGVSHARHYAAEQTTGDVVITSDTHCLYPRRSLWRLAHWAMRQRAVIVPPVNLLSLDGKKNQVIEGGGFELSTRGIRIQRPRRVRRWPSLYGSIYLMRRDVWEHLGGWLRLPGYWGGEEQIVSTVAYLLGVPIRVMSGESFRHHTCTHRQYREHDQYPYELPPHHPAEIAHYYHAACFPATYEDVWQPMLAMRYRYEMSEQTTQVSKQLAEWIKTRAVWDEHRFFRTVLGIDDISTHPLVDFERKRRERIRELLNGPSTPSDIDEPGPVEPVDRDNSKDAG